MFIVAACIDIRQQRTRAPRKNAKYLMNKLPIGNNLCIIYSLFCTNVNAEHQNSVPNSHRTVTEPNGRELCNNFPPQVKQSMRMLRQNYNTETRRPGRPPFVSSLVRNILWTIYHNTTENHHFPHPNTLCHCAINTSSSSARYSFHGINSLNAGRVLVIIKIIIGLLLTKCCYKIYLGSVGLVIWPRSRHLIFFNFVKYVSAEEKFMCLVRRGCCGNSTEVFFYYISTTSGWKVYLACLLLAREDISSTLHWASTTNPFFPFPLCFFFLWKSTS